MPNSSAPSTDRRPVVKNKTILSYVKSLQPNIKAEVEQEIQDFLQRLIMHNSVYGVVLLGGLGVRDYMDQYSDIDISVFTQTKKAKELPLPFEFHYLTKSGRLLEFNIHQLIIENEYESAWDEGKKEAYSRGIIYYDPTGEVKKLLKTKTKFDKKEALERLIYIVQQYEWKAQIHSIRACKRGFPQAGNDLIDESLDLLVEAIYLLEKKFRPHRKWRLVYLEHLQHFPQDIVKIINRAKITPEHTEKVVKQRVALLDLVFEYVKLKTIANYPKFPKNAYEHFYVHNIQLNSNPLAIKAIEGWKNYLTREEYERVKGLSCYNLAPRTEKVLKLVKDDNIDLYKRLVYKQ